MEKVDSGKYPHKINDHVIFKNYGICNVADIVTKDFAGFGERVYYLLRSVYDEHSVIYVPVDSDLALKMNTLLSESEINSLIDDFASGSDTSGRSWVPDIKLRSAEFTKLLENGSSADILWLVKELSLYKLELEKVKKKLYASDTKILTGAEKIITEEFAFVLGIKKDEVIPYILSRISEDETA